MVKFKVLKVLFEKKWLIGITLLAMLVSAFLFVDLNGYLNVIPVSLVLFLLLIIAFLLLALLITLILRIFRIRLSLEIFTVLYSQISLTVITVFWMVYVLIYDKV